MITLLLGTDLVAKKNYISQQAKQLGSDVEIFTESSTFPNFDIIFEPQLFGPAKLVVLDHCWKKIDDTVIAKLLGRGSSKSSNIFVVEDSLDKRKKVNQEFLKDKRVQVIQLDAPIGTQQSTQWIKNFAKENKISIDDAASMALARALLIDEDSSLDTARVQTELAKLSAYAGNEKITAAVVAELTENATGVDIFALLNAIAEKNKKLAIKILDQYFETEAADDKTNAIKVSALLSDQFRSLLIATDASSRGLPDNKVLELTGWKSGRLFIMKKLSRNFNALQLKSALAKLENLDRELKTGSMPPQVVLDLIIADL